MEFQSGAVRPIGSIEEGWSIIKDDYWTFFLMSLVTIIIIVFVAMILGGINNAITFVLINALGIATKDASEVGKISVALAPQIVSLVISSFTNIIVSVISGVLFCGYFNALSRKASSGITEFSDLFGGAKYFQPVLIVSVILSLLRFVVGLVMMLIGVAFGVSAFGADMLLKDGKLNQAVLGPLLGLVFLLLFVYFIINILIGICTTFVYPLIARRNLSAFEALALSTRAGLANALQLIGFFILQGLMVLGGVLLCFVGILFVAPVLYASFFAAYRSVFGDTTENVYQPPPPPPIFNKQPDANY